MAACSLSLLFLKIGTGPRAAQAGLQLTMVAKAGFGLLILLPPLLECQYHRGAPPPPPPVLRITMNDIVHIAVGRQGHSWVLLRHLPLKDFAKSCGEVENPVRYKLYLYVSVCRCGVCDPHPSVGAA